MDGILVAKIGGSTLGSHDTTLEDLAALQRRGERCVVVHGGGALISDWLKRLDVPTRFERGLRVTDDDAMKVVTAVLAGLVNKELVAALSSCGARALGLSGADGGILRGRIAEPALGLVGDVTDVDAEALNAVVGAGYMPVVAPVALEWSDGHPTGRLLNTNADTAAGAIAAALGARRLVFLTDVPGVKADGAVIPALSPERAGVLVADGVIEGGMIPKVEACLRAAAAGATSVILDGREEHALIRAVDGEALGTTVG